MYTYVVRAVCIRSKRPDAALFFELLSRFIAVCIGDWWRVVVNSHFLLSCGELRIGDVGKEVTISGWVQKRRDKRGMAFVDVRDRWLIMQASYAAIELHFFSICFFFRC